jgi:Vacuolar protein sorting-associated protein 62
MADEDLLRRYVPYLQYDSLESFRSDSAAILPEHFFDDGSKWSYANSLKRKGGSVLASARPKNGQKQLELSFLGKRYTGNGEARATDFLDAAGRRYVEDARRLHADPRYADRVYGHVVHQSNGQTWLQYWFFYYYNDKNYLGIGLHEGDWEMIQIRLGRDGKPNAATFAQHRDGEAFNWSDLELRASPDGDVPVVYVGRGSHASFARSGEHWPMFPLPPDYSDGKGPLIRPAFEAISDQEPGWTGWPGKWGSSDSSPTGPSQKGQWSDPTAFHVELGGAATRGRVRRRARPTPTLPAPPAPELSFSRLEDQVVVKYEFPKRLRAGAARPERIVVSVDTPDDNLPPASHAFTVRTRSGVFAHPMRLEDKHYVVRTISYSEEGVQSTLVSADLPPEGG